MSTRPTDYGDQYPSDSGDQLPTDKTSTFQETDYKINDQASARPPSNLVTGQPELIPPEGNEVKPQGRVAYTGVITKIEKGSGNNIGYWVLRQDFKRGLAFQFGNETPEYSDLRVGDEVELTAGEVQGQWRIIGSKSQTLLPTVTKRCTLDPTDNESHFKFNDTVQTTDHVNVFNFDSDNEIRIDCAEKIQLNLLFKAIVTSTKPKEVQTINVITDMRLGASYIETLEGMIEGVWLTPPTWVNKIALTSCGY